MIYERCKIPDVVLCKPQVHTDDRGYFFESFRLDSLEEFLGYALNFCQDNESKSQYGVIRGLHFQRPPFAQTKLIRVIQGAIVDVAVDMRKGSKTLGHYVTAELTAENKHQLYVPKGFAHGFAVLSEEAIIAYKSDNYYAPQYDGGVNYADKTLAVNWPIPLEKRILSAKDQQLPNFDEVPYLELQQAYSKL